MIWVSNGVLVLALAVLCALFYVKGRMDGRAEFGRSINRELLRRLHDERVKARRP